MTDETRRPRKTLRAMRAESPERVVTDPFNEILPVAVYHEMMRNRGEMGEAAEPNRQGNSLERFEQIEEQPSSPDTNSDSNADLGSNSSRDSPLEEKKPSRKKQRRDSPSPPPPQIQQDEVGNEETLTDEQADEMERTAAALRLQRLRKEQNSQMNDDDRSKLDSESTNEKTSGNVEDNSDDHESRRL